jgi:hypothetical protein
MDATESATSPPNLPLPDEGRSRRSHEVETKVEPLPRPDTIDRLEVQSRPCMEVMNELALEYSGHTGHYAGRSFFDFRRSRRFAPIRDGAGKLETRFYLVVFSSN